VTLVRNWRSHSRGVEWEIPKLGEAPEPVIMPALLEKEGGVSFFSSFLFWMGLLDWDWD
jgi:hypothetical protein